jgi:hypothetical protein
MQIAQLVRLKPSIPTNFCEDFPRLDPVLLSGSEDRVVLSESYQKFPLCRSRNAAPQLGQDYGAIADKPIQALDLPAVAVCAQLIQPESKYQR